MTDRVLVVMNVHDGDLIDGIAEVNGRPCFFSREFSEEQDDYTKEYRLWTLDAEQLETGLALDQCFREWRSRRGALPWPSLERERRLYGEWGEIKALLRSGEGVLAVPSFTCVRDEGRGIMGKTWVVSWSMLTQ